MKTIIGSLTVLLSLAGLALADEVDASGTGFDRPLASPSRAFEMTIGAGYTQGAGDMAGGGARVQDLSGPGATLELKVGYRATPHLAVGAYGTATRHERGGSVADNIEVDSATAGLYADWHFRPDRSVDPWIELASGWRGMWLSPDPGANTSFNGWEIARLQLGMDYRVWEDLAVGPVIGASVNAYFTRKAPGTDGFDAISDTRSNFNFTAGIQGRFDIGGRQESRGPAEQAVAAR